MSSRRRDPFTPLCFVALLATACGPDPAVRKATLEPGSGIPAGTAVAVGSELRVEFSAAEPLSDGHHHLLWADTPTDNVFLTEIAPGMQHTTRPADHGVAIEEVNALLVTEENEDDEPPSIPSLSTIVRGALGKPLLFGGTLSAESFHSASGTATLKKKRVHVTTEGLPTLPSGYHYEVWLDFGAEEHVHGAEDEHDEGAAGAAGAAEDDHEEEEAERYVNLGRLLGETLMAEHDSSVVTAKELQITIESDNGHEDHKASAIALRGLVGVAPTASQQAQAPEEHDESPGHLH